MPAHELDLLQNLYDDLLSFAIDERAEDHLHTARRREAQAEALRNLLEFYNKWLDTDGH